MSHDEDYEFERAYWGDCCNTYDEETKQFVYGRLMGLRQTHYGFDVAGKRILDIGGGPSSLLLKAVNLSEGKVVDPIVYPQWTVDRYASKSISVSVSLGEDIEEEGWDEVWMYNCLQHTVDPAKIIRNALRAAPIFRIFEWVDVPAHEGHPHELTEVSLNEWIGQPGCTTNLSEFGCYGRAYYGCFQTRCPSL
jgi:hypothetical protein